MIGKTLGHYRIVGRLGKGGMGEVWVAEDSRLNRRVALKTLPPEMATDADRRARFEREAQAIAALNHPNIVTIHSVEQADDVSFITMELVEGKTLTDLIPGDGLPLARFFDVAIPLADALSAAHDKGITHRDLKPDNVMVTGEGRVKVLDFGLAKLAEDRQDGPAGDAKTQAATVTEEGKILGTVAYMSPEQAEGKPVDARSDVFSMGVVLYQMATGRRPFEGETSVSTITSIMRDTPTTIGELKPSLPRHLGRVVDRCLAKRPDRRYQAALDVRNELEGLRDEVASGEVSGVATGATVAARRAVASRGLLFGVIGVAVLAIIAAAVFLLSRGGGTRAPAAAELDKSVAVLPFANMSEDEGNEFFSDGLAEELLNMLSRVPGLRVAARTSSFHFKGQTGNIAEIGRQLNVATILEGSVRRADDRVRVTAQLVNAADGFHLWSDTYDRKLDDIFAIQEEIASEVADALKVTLLGRGSEASPLEARATKNVEAYEAYMLGQQRMARRTSASLTVARDQFQRAIDLDPDYALAHVGLADSHLRLSEYATMPKAEAQAKAEALITRALELDDRLGQAHASLGNLLADRGELEKSFAAFERAIELNPNYAMAHMWYGLAMMGRDRRRAEELFAKTLELDPLSPPANANMAFVLMERNRPEEALERLQHAVTIEPGYANAHFMQGQVYADFLDRPDDAIRAYRRAVEGDPGNLNSRMQLGFYLSDLGRDDEALELYRETIELDPDYVMAHAAIGQLHANRGRLDEAVRWLHRGLERDPTSIELNARLLFMYLGLADEQSAVQRRERIEELQPNNFFVNVAAAVLHLYRGELEQAEALARELAAIMPRADFIRDTLWEADMRAGRYSAARERFRDFRPELYEPDPTITARNVNPSLSLAAALLGDGERERADLLLRRAEAFVASRDPRQRRATYRMEPVAIHALRGSTDQALDALRAAMEHGAVGGWWSLGNDPRLASLREEPRFGGLIVEMRAEADRQRKTLAAAGLANP